jgi:hypothetical protein
MKRLFGVMAVASVLGVAAAGIGGGAAPSIEGTYELSYRELPDGSELRPPEVVGLMTLTKDRRNFNVYWKDKGKPVSVSVISKYTLTEKEFSEQNVYYMMNDESAGKGAIYDLGSAKATSPVTAAADRVTFTMPLHGEPAVVFTKDGFTATQEKAFVDHWKRVE